MSNSKLVSYINLSPNGYFPRNTTIKKITIHHTAFTTTVETLGGVFANPNREASANYGIGYDGRVGQFLDEANGAWTSSSYDNDMQAVTIEVSNDGGAPDWHVSDLSLNSLIELCIDICQRNNIKSLNYTGDAKGNLTTHNMFAATACPGPYLKSKIPYIVEQVNLKLNTPVVTPVNPIKAIVTIYRVRKSWNDKLSQIGAFYSLAGAKKACISGYTVYDGSGNVIYPVQYIPKVPVVVIPKSAIKEAIDVRYKAYANKWYSEIVNFNNVNDMGYAGVDGVAISGIMAKLSKGGIKYRVHTINGQWYDWVTGYDPYDNNFGYAGSLGKQIDCIQMQIVGLPNYNVQYRVSNIGTVGYLEWITNYNTKDDYGYAGIFGVPIDKLQIRIN